MRYRFILAALACVLMAGCGPDSGPDNLTGPIYFTPDVTMPPNSSKIDPEVLNPVKFASCDAYQDYLTDAFVDWMTKRLPCEFGLCTLGPDPVELGKQGALAATNASHDNVLQTNTRIADIDEGGMVRADSNGNVYILNDWQLIVARGNPNEEPVQIGEVPIHGFAKEMLLDEANQRLVLVSDGFGRYERSSQRFFTQVWLVDISDPTAPSLDGPIILDGQLLASRRHEDRIHLFTWRDLFLPETFFDAGGWELVQQYHHAKAADNTGLVLQTAAILRALVHESIARHAADYLPRYRAVDGTYTNLDCRSLSAPAVTVNPAYTMLASFDSDGANLEIASIVNNVGAVYATANSAYVVQSSYRWWWDPVQADQTAIHKFSIGDCAAEYQATAVIPGQTRDNLYLSEHEGVLRAATSELKYDGGLQHVSHVFALEDDGQGVLEVIGSVEGFQTGEDIVAVRFEDDRGYIVTLRQNDPLFTFDLSDPYGPRLMGDLRLPGFLTFVHPLDEHHLLTLGREDGNDGNIGPLALRIFDVGDLSAPRLAHTFILDDNSLLWSGWSAANYDYHAFNVHEGLLSLPFVFLGPDPAQSFNGFVFFDIDTQAGIVETGRIDQNDLLDAEYCEDFARVCDDTSYWLNPRRSIVTTHGERRYVYTASNAAVAVAAADDPANILASYLIELPSVSDSGVLGPG